MKLYFQNGKKRLAIDTDRRAYSTNYFFLGGWKEYIKLNESGYREILAQCVKEDYAPKWEGEQ